VPWKFPTVMEQPLWAELRSASTGWPGRLCGTRGDMNSKIAILIAPILLLILGLSSPASDLPRRVDYGFDGVVTKVISGDKFLVNTSLPYLSGRSSVRLYGVYAPVMSVKGRPGQPYAEKAKAILKEKLGKRKVRIFVRELDEDGMQVALVYVDSHLINEEMLRGGWAWCWKTQKYRYDQLDEDVRLYQAGNEAQMERRGLWHGPNPQPPWKFRDAVISPR
jgi:endonuclease YncB( thermonuclease family)